MIQYFTYYAESNIVCLILFGIMLLRDLINMDRQESQIKFDNALVAFMLYFVSDTLWSGIIAGILPKSLFLAVTLNFANYLFMTGIAYLWLRFVMAVEQVPGRDSPRNRILLTLPFLVSAVTQIVVYLVAPHLLLSENLVLQPLGTVFLVTVPVIYITAVLVYALRRTRKEVNPLEKRRHLFYGMFPLLCIAGGAVQILLMPQTPIFCFCCVILMLMIYLQADEQKISTDPLTGLSNRGQLMCYVSQDTSLRREGRETIVMMFDINDFKIINDTFGHAEGDRALRIVTAALRETITCRDLPYFLGRYGGDEFVMILHPAQGDPAPEPLIVELRARVEALCNAEKTPYLVSVGVGCEPLAEGETFQKCLQRADHKLYLDKEQCKSHGNTTVRR